MGHAPPRHAAVTPRIDAASADGSRMRLDTDHASRQKAGAREGAGDAATLPPAQELCHNRRRARPLVYLWAFPTTAVGLSLFAFSALLGKTRHRVVHGVLEVHGGLITWLLTHCTFLRGGASAMTLGHVVLGRDELLLHLTRDHERVHVRQCERWGPFFLPAYGLASLWVLLRGGRAYEDNPFEREAFGATPRRPAHPAATIPSSPRAL